MDTSGGVIQYDLGKALSGGQFKRTGILNRPPKILLTALTTLQAHHLTEDSRIVEFVSNPQAKIAPHKATRFTRPMQEDCLFQPEYNHITSDMCIDCDRSKLVPRPPREHQDPVIHYGLIGSANQVVKVDQVHSAPVAYDILADSDVGQEEGSLRSLTTREEHSILINSGGGAQTNNVNSGSGQQINNSAYVGTQSIQSVTFNQKQDFNFRGPVGILRGQAPYIASELFIGRIYELNEIARLLHSDHKFQKQRRLVLGGIGGIGKTQLAIAYAESGRGSYSSVFWLNAVSEAILKDSYRSIASLIFDVEEPGVPKNTGCLLIFDNYDDPTQFWIDYYYPPASHGAIVVTSRRPDQVAGTSLHIKPFQNVKDSLAILQTRLKRENVQSDPYATRLAERLAGLPLALATAGTYLRRSTFTFERYLQEYEKRWNISPRRPLQLQEYQDRTLYTTWDLSYSRLEKEDPDAAKILSLLAYFDNQILWYGLFRAGLTDSSPEWLREVITDDVNFNEVMGALAEYFFLDSHQTSGSWSMHNCVHDWTLAALNKDIDANHYWADDFANLSYSALAAHATRLIQERLCTNDIIYNIAPRRLDQASLIANLLRDQVLLLAAEKMYQYALAGKEKELGADHASTLETVNNLGILYRNQGRLEQAEQMFHRALAGREKELGADHTSTLRTVKNIGILYRLQGRLDQAEQKLHQALARCEKALGADHVLTLDTVNNLGIVYCVQGKLDQAEHMYERALAGREKAFGADHTLTLRTVNNLGTLYRVQGNLDQAEQMLQWALAGKEKALGADHTSTLETVNNLGILYHVQGNLDQAEHMLQRALAGRVKALGADHISTLRTVNNLGMLYCAQGRLNQAEQIYHQALAGREKALGADHTSTLNTVNNLGILYRVQGRLDQAEQMLQRALDGRFLALGVDHTSTLDTISNLEILYRAKGRLDQVEQMYMRIGLGLEKRITVTVSDFVTTILQ
ncbi:hypothetical protein N7486_009665 [Penicillium sp. IBT 16267x]|nr:hypothetical protein N7486_009665 [Penicillium sp. IBT 16267x]